MAGAPAPATGGTSPLAGNQAPAAGRPRWWVTLPMMLGSGALIALQSQVNGGLSRGLGTGMRSVTAAALISFGSGLVVLTVFALVHRPTGRGIAELGAAVRSRQIPLWLVLGGLGGAFFVVSQGLSAPTLGITFFILCFVAGQAVMALLVDHHGWGPNGPTALATGRVVGAVLAVVAVGIEGVGVLTAVPVTAVLLLLAALPLVAGAVNSGQQGMNGRLAVRVGPWVTTWNNFFVGTLGLVVFWALTFLLPGDLVRLPPQPWLYLGGISGVGFIWAATITVRAHGVLVVGVFAVAGQVLTAAVIALLTSPAVPGAATWLAAATSLVGAVVVGLSGRRRPTAGRPAR